MDSRTWETIVSCANFRARVYFFEACNVLTFGDCECWTPLVSQYIEADASVGVDVRMVNAGGEVDLWGLERIIGGEMDC
jgi:hypothetical protein